MVPILDVTIYSHLQEVAQSIIDKSSSYCVTGSTTINSMEYIRQNILRGELGGFCSVATVLAGIICAGMMLKYSHDYLEGHGITLWELIRPLFIFVLIINFNSFVVTPIHSICNIFTRSVERQCYVSWGEFMKTYINVTTAAMYSTMNNTASNIADAWKADESDEDRQIDKEIEEQYGGDLLAALRDEGFNERHPQPSVWEQFGNGLGHIGKGLLGTLGGVIGGTFDMAGTALLSFINGLLFLAMKILLMCQQIYCYVYLIILSLIGPFAFAIGIVPAFRSTIPGWIARYIQVASWIPIGFIVLHINLEIMKFLTVFTSEYSIGGKYVVLVAGIVCVASVSAVPKIAAYIIESTGLNDAHGNVNAYMRSGARAVSGAVKSSGSSAGKAAVLTAARKATIKV